MRRITFIVTLALLAQFTFAAPTTSPADRIKTLIQNLGDPDPATRQKAEESLAAIGYPARPALVKAARTGSPQVAARAAEVLMKLPWWQLGDSDNVRGDLVKYGDADNEERQRLIEDIAIQPGGAGALLRLVQEDPSDTVSWHAAVMLRILDDQRVSAALRKLDLADARVQTVALTAQAFLPVDRPKGLELCRRAIEEDAEDDGSDDPNLDFAYRVLIADLYERGDKSGAIKLQRLRVHRAATSGDASASAFELFALYADHGITPEFADDLFEFKSYLGRPEVMYALARLQVADDASPLMNEAIDRAAMASSLTPLGHLRVAGMVSDHAWDDESRLELYAMLAATDQHPDVATVSARFSARLALARCAELGDNHPAVAEHLEAAVQECDALGGALQFDLTGLRNQVSWHHLHAARQSGDKETATKLLRELLEVPDPDSDVAIEVVNDLKADRRADDATKYFEKAYALSKAKLAMPLKSAESLNNLAWLCARCGEHTDEAISVAERAMALEPENYAYIDTAASAYFAAGNSTKAAELEKRALIMRPCDTFMKKQLEMFEKGAKAQSHEGTKENQ